MRSPEEVRYVQQLVEEGLNDCAIARLTELPRTTIRDWRHATRWEAVPSADSCPACGHPLHQFGELGDRYAYLLGLYLGDGHIVHHRRGVYRLTISLDARYPGIVEECRQAIAEVMRRPVGLHFRHGGTCAWVTKASKQWPCVFPQHGPGPKHGRRIELTDWQRAVVERHPRELVRGLIHSDGCRFVNTVRHDEKSYAYARYSFSNRSDDIRRIFCDTCDLLGVQWRVMNRWTISVAKRASVARLDEFVGPKA
jgi:hypothetical protein